MRRTPRVSRNQPGRMSWGARPGIAALQSVPARGLPWSCGPGDRGSLDGRSRPDWSPRTGRPRPRTLPPSAGYALRQNPGCRATQAGAVQSGPATPPPSAHHCRSARRRPPGRLRRARSRPARSPGSARAAPGRCHRSRSRRRCAAWAPAGRAPAFRAGGACVRRYWQGWGRIRARLRLSRNEQADFAPRCPGSAGRTTRHRNPDAAMHRPLAPRRGNARADWR